MNKSKKEVRFWAIIIPVKDVKGFFIAHPDYRDKFSKIGEDYAKFRRDTGRTPYPDYVIVNQDEPYIDKVWNIVLDGEDKKLNTKNTDEEKK